MRSFLLTTAVTVSNIAAVANCQLLGLDITALLDSLGPAPEGDPRFTNWKAPGAGDVRSPCPGLNTLANHGFINHSGKNLTIPGLLKGLAAGMNIGADFTTLIGGVGLLSSPNPFGGSFDLNDLDQHDFPIEHDGSLSRQDAYYGNDYSFNQSVFDQVLAYYHGSSVTTTPAASMARYHRVSDSVANNPQAIYGVREFVLSSGETGLYVQTMSSPSNNSAPVSYVEMFFEQEKLPYELGWRPSPDAITLVTLGEYILELFAANPDKVAEGITLASDSYLNTLEVIVGGSEILGNLTSGISKALGL